MASALKTLVVRYPCQAAAAGFVPKASFSTTVSAVRPLCLARAPLRQQCPLALIPKTFARANSQQTTPPPNAPNAAAVTGHPALDWNSFFALRLKRRRYQLAFSVTNGLFSGALGAVVLATGVAEPLIAQIPLDPFLTLGLMTMAASGMGWLLGPTIGSTVFYTMNRGWKTQIQQKEAQFFARVKKHRADPSNSSASNPGLSPPLLLPPSAMCRVLTPSQFPTSTARRSRASRATDNGSRIKGPSTRRRLQPLYKSPPLILSHAVLWWKAKQIYLAALIRNGAVLPSRKWAPLFVATTNFPRTCMYTLSLTKISYPLVDFGHS